MPELPEVQTIVNDLNQAEVCGKTIIKVEVNYPKTITAMTVENFQEWLTGQKFKTISRRAKYIIFNINNERILLVHLRMTGKFLIQKSSEKIHKHERVSIHLDNGYKLSFLDTRKFARFFPTNDPEKKLKHLGPEPLDSSLTTAHFRKMILASGKKLKPLLLDQSFIAGLGNIYTDEALWTANLHPEKIAMNISKSESDLLLESIRKVLLNGLKNNGTSLGDGAGNFTSLNGASGDNKSSLMVYHRTGKPCKRCNTPIARTIIAQRSTHYCPKCQKI